MPLTAVTTALALQVEQRESESFRSADARLHRPTRVDSYALVETGAVSVLVQRNEKDEETGQYLFSSLSGFLSPEQARDLAFRLLRNAATVEEARILAED